MRYTCQECGYISPRWLGKCPECGAWNSLVEEKQIASVGKKRSVANVTPPVLLSEVDMTNEERYSTGIGELDRVLGGGIVPGSLVLMGGDPGIGKSTLLLQAAGILSRSKKVLYISGEESLKQVGMRANRLGVGGEKLMLLCETDMQLVGESLTTHLPQIAIIDSIQTMNHPEIPSASGSVSQVRECTALLMRYAKKHNICIFIVGHVTKEGTLAGPRVLEHIVDTVLYFEGDRHLSYRILRTVKNRFGSNNELGIFEMQNQGLIEVDNPSALFMARKPLLETPGSVIVSSIEGTRPILVEIQALVCPNAYGMPRRMTTGVDQNRVALIIAVLEKRVGLRLGNCDAYVNVVGGVRLVEPAVDLAVALALASSYREIPVNSNMVVVGEIGLTGEVRQVNALERRLKEAENMGFKEALVPQMGIEKISASEIKLLSVDTVALGIEMALNK